MALIRRLILMIQFFTRIPIPVKINIKDDDFGKGLVLAPVVGLIIGCIVAGVWYLSSLIFPGYICAILAMTTYVLVTGGIHLDGLGDSMDGLFSGKPRER